jgi:hypothetical protein
MYVPWPSLFGSLGITGVKALTENPKEPSFYKCIRAIISDNLFSLIHNKFESTEFTAEKPRIWGCERVHARSHPQIRYILTEIPKET